jgi:type IX secretion system PorP/SprF family membrane protein
LKDKDIFMRKIKISIVVFVLLIASVSQAQQTPLYSQYMFNMLNINPAYAGNRESGNFTMLLRKQWVGFPGAPSSGTLTYDQRVAEKNFSLGGQVYFDNLGIEKRTGFQGFYSYSAPFEKSTLSIGLSLGMLNYSANYNRTNPVTLGDPSLQVATNTYLPTAGIGAILSSEKWYIGLSAPALLKTQMSLKGQSTVRRAGADGHFFLTGGYVIPVSTDVTLKPSIMLKSVSGAPVQADFNMNVWFNNLVAVGLSYRSKDAVVGLAELQLTPQLRMGYSYDYNVSDLVTYNNGSHEIMLRFEFGRATGKKINSPRYF